MNPFDPRKKKAPVDNENPVTASTRVVEKVTKIASLTKHEPPLPTPSVSNQGATAATVTSPMGVSTTRFTGAPSQISGVTTSSTTGTQPPIGFPTDGVTDALHPTGFSTANIPGTKHPTGFPTDKINSAPPPGVSTSSFTGTQPPIGFPTDGVTDALHPTGFSTANIPGTKHPTGFPTDKINSAPPPGVSTSSFTGILPQIGISISNFTDTSPQIGFSRSSFTDASPQISVTTANDTSTSPPFGVPTNSISVTPQIDETMDSFTGMQHPTDFPTDNITHVAPLFSISTVSFTDAPPQIGVMTARINDTTPPIRDPKNSITGSPSAIDDEVVVSCFSGLLDEVLRKAGWTRDARPFSSVSNQKATVTTTIAQPRIGMSTVTNTSPPHPSDILTNSSTSTLPPIDNDSVSTVCSNLLDEMLRKAGREMTQHARSSLSVYNREAIATNTTTGPAVPPLNLSIASNTGVTPPMGMRTVGVTPSTKPPIDDVGVSTSRSSVLDEILRNAGFTKHGQSSSPVSNHDAIAIPALPPVVTSTASIHGTAPPISSWTDSTTSMPPPIDDEDVSAFYSSLLDEILRNAGYTKHEQPSPSVSNQEAIATTTLPTTSRSTVIFPDAQYQMDAFTANTTSTPPAIDNVGVSASHSNFLREMLRAASMALVGQPSPLAHGQINQDPMVPSSSLSSIGPMNRQEILKDVVDSPQKSSDKKGSGKLLSNKNRKKVPQINPRKPNFPVDLIHQMINRQADPENKDDTALPIFLAAIEEYVATEVLELAGNLAMARGSIEISEHDVIAAIFSDEGLRHTLEDCMEY